MTKINKINLIREVPARTPSIISYRIRNLIKNKIVCELGCAEGDNMILLSRYAKKVIGLDLNVNRLKYAQRRELDVRLSDYRIESIPSADVYYFWPSNPLRDIPYLIWKIINNSNSNIIIISGSDNAIKYERLCSYIYSIFGKRYSFNYNEGPGPRENGIFTINIFYKSNLLFYHYPIIFLLTYFLRIISFILLRLKVGYK
tara:strand:+ start:826 stop:1428 length:603 start_codon:yes stop_codon:yes gene_type:complete